MSLRNILTSLLVITAIVIGLMLVLGDPIHVATVVKIVLIAALASAAVQWFKNRKTIRG